MDDDRIFSEDYLEDDTSPLQRSDSISDSVSIPEEKAHPEEVKIIETPSVPEKPQAPKKITRKRAPVTPEQPKQEIDPALLAYMETDHFRNKLYLHPPQVIERIVEREVPVERVIEKLVPVEVERIVEKPIYVDRVQRDIPDIAFGSRRRNSGWLS